MREENIWENKKKQRKQNKQLLVHFYIINTTPKWKSSWQKQDKTIPWGDLHILFFSLEWPVPRPVTLFHSENNEEVLTHENKMSFKPQGTMYLFPIWNISGFFLSNLLEGNKKYSFQLKNSKKNTVMHNTCHLIFAEHSTN